MLTVGVPKEMKTAEHRVALTPDGVRELERSGVDVFVEAGAGADSAIPDADYAAAGATDRATAAEAWAQQTGREGQGAPGLGVRCTCAPTSRCSPTSISRRTPRSPRRCWPPARRAIAYETVQLPDGALPLLAPMSEVAGRLATQVGAHYLERQNGGRGVLLGGAPGVRPARVVVLGAGNVGWNSAWIAAGMEAEVLLLDKNLDRLRFVDQIHRGRIITMASNRGAVERAVGEADLVIGAVLVAGGRAPVVVTEDMVRADEAGRGDRRRRRRPGRMHRDHPRDDPHRPGLRDARRHPLRGRQHARRRAVHVDLRAHERDARRTCSTLAVDGPAAACRADPALAHGLQHRRRARDERRRSPNSWAPTSRCRRRRWPDLAPADVM